MQCTLRRLLNMYRPMLQFFKGISSFTHTVFMDPRKVEAARAALSYLNLVGNYDNKIAGDLNFKQ